MRELIVDPYGKHRTHGTNRHMREKEVVITPWEIKIIAKPAPKETEGDGKENFNSTP